MVTESPLVHAQKSMPMLLMLFFGLVYLPFVYYFGFKYLFLRHVDFPSFYWGAKVAFESGLSPYGPFAFAPAIAAMEQFVYPYLYPPPSLLLFYPFTFFGYGVAKALMLALNHATVLFLAYLLLFRLRMIKLDLRTPFGLGAAMFFTAYLFTFSPIMTNLNHGQVNLIVLALIGLSWLALKEGRASVWIAAPLSVAILLKSYPVLFLPLLLFKRKYAAFLWTVAIGAAITAASYFLLPNEVWGEWFARVLPTGGYGEEPWGLFSPAAPANQSINGFAFRLFMDNEFTPTLYHSPLLTKLTAYTLSAIVAAATLMAVLRSSRAAPNGAELIDLEFSLLLLAMFLVGPLSWDHHVVYALPAVLLLSYRLLSAGKTAYLGLVVAPAAYALGAAVPYFFNRLSDVTLLAVLSMSLKFYAVVTLWLIGVVLLLRWAKVASQTPAASGESRTVRHLPQPAVPGGATSLAPRS